MGLGQEHGDARFLDHLADAWDRRRSMGTCGAAGLEDGQQSDDHVDRRRRR
ncbi:MAG: hypothetical protein R2838_07170 [Caldilineaceae bacterium]